VTRTLRPYWQRLIVPGLFTAISLAILVSLGMWQLQRKAWKEGLIATLEAQMAASPAPLAPPSQWATLNRDTSEFRRVRFRAEAIANAKPVYLYTGASALRADVKQPGYFVFAPARLPDGQIVVVNWGYAPVAGKTQLPPGTIEINGYIRWPEAPRWFVSAPDTDEDIWLVRDPAAMAKAGGWGMVAPFYIDQESPTPTGGLPRPGPLTVRLKNDHLGYAITWFGLAASLIAVFIGWAIRERYNRTV
jgi:surfeit locus 1 family protein